MPPLAQFLTSLRTEFRHAWFPTLLICSIVLLHDLATGSQHGGLVVVLLIAAFILARPPRLRRHSPLENWRHSFIYAVTVVVATLVSLGTLDWLKP
ncbi:hypothetical protein LMIY3S_05539 [Labrys miyagiensis]